MTTISKLTVFGEPRTKKNSQRIVYMKGHAAIMPSKNYVEYEKLWADQHIGICGPPIEVPCSVECHYYMSTKRRVDLTNLLEATDDLLVKCGVLADDNSKIIVSHDFSRVHYDKANPRVEITIREFEKGYYDEDLLI